MTDSDYLAWPFFEPRHAELQAEVDAWAAREIAPLEASNESTDVICREIVNRLGRAGWLRYAVPKAYGGVHDQLDVRALCLIRETLARHAGLADFAFAMQGLGTGALSLFGEAALAAQYLSAVARGEVISAFALSESEAGSDVAALRTRAERDGDDYIINGAKTWISNAGIADCYTVFARTGEAPGARGLSAFFVDAGTPGLSVSERIDITAPHPLGTLEFDNCRVPAERIIGEPGRGFQVAMATLDVFRATVGAAALGFARHALAATQERAQSRELFGGAMGDLQMVQSMIADMRLRVETSALLVYRAAWLKDSGAERVTSEAAMAKLHATEEGQKVIDAAVQLHGGLGVTLNHPVEKLYREIRALRIYEGASEVQKLIIARNALAAT